MNEFGKSELFVCGTKRQYRILSYVFPELTFAGYGNGQKALIKALSENRRIILCSEDKKDVFEALDASVRHRCMFDDELIETLRFPVDDCFKDQNVYIWGTGFWCGEFERWLKESHARVDVAGYVDSDPQKQRSVRNGKPVLSPEELQNQEGILLIATDYTKYVQIESIIEDIGLENYKVLSIHRLMDDPTEDFYRVYKAGCYFKAGCLNWDDNVRITRNGIVRSCCMETGGSYGNIYVETFENIWTSKRARINRCSLITKSFVFCDHTRCPFLSNIPKSELSPEEDIWEEPKQGEGGIPDSIAPEIDYACNLRCISCRNELNIDQSVERSIYTDVIIKKITHIPTKIIVNTVGEPLVSQNSMRLIDHPKMLRNGQLGLYTNGTRMTPELLNSLLEKYKAIDLSVSVDASTEGTYKKIRRGGNFQKLMANLEYAAAKRAEGRISFYQLNYVVQSTNVFEMEMFADLAKRLRADRVVMNGIENWGIFDREEFDRISVVRNGGIKEEYQCFFTKKLLDNPIVNFYNLAHLLNLEPAKMTMI